MAARKRRVALSDDWKMNVRAENIVTRLVKHVNGEVEMSSTQVNAAKIVLAKILPDLKQMDMSLTGKISLEQILSDIDDHK